MFWCVSVHLATFNYYTEQGAKWVELVQLMHNFVPLRRIGIFRNERIRSTPLDPNMMFWCVSYFLGAFGTVWLPYETRCKIGRTSAKVREWSCVGIFRNEHTRSTPLDPKQTFCYVSYYLGAFGTVWLPYGTRCKMGRTSAKDRDTKSRRNISQGTHLIHPIGP